MNRQTSRSYGLENPAISTSGPSAQSHTNPAIVSVVRRPQPFDEMTSQLSASSPRRQCVRGENRVRQREGDVTGSRYRRIEHTSFESIHQEIYMYLDSAGVCNSTLSRSGSVVEMAVHETFNILRSCWCSPGNVQDNFEPVRNLSVIALQLLLTYGRHKLTEHGEYAVLCGGNDELPWLGCIIVALASYMHRRVDNRSITERAAVPLNNMHHNYAAVGPVLGHGKGKSVNLCIGGVVYPDSSTLQRRGMCRENEEESEGGTRPVGNAKESALSPPFFFAHTSLSSQPPPPLPSRQASRILLINCHSFGWLDEVPNENYDSSSCFLRKLDSALLKIMNIPPRTSRNQQGSDADPFFLASAALGRSCCTIALLSDTIVMDGGVPSLSVARHCQVFNAHQKYGRGIACLVSPIGGHEENQGAGAWHTPNDSLSAPRVAANSSYALDANASQINEERVQLLDHSFGRTHTPSGYSYGRANVSSPHNSVVPPPPFRVESPPSGSRSPVLSAADIASSLLARREESSRCRNAYPSQPWLPVSCGERVGPGIVAQAVLLAPRGPLVVHLQLEHAAGLASISTSHVRSLSLGRLRYGTNQTDVSFLRQRPSSPLALTDDFSLDSSSYNGSLRTTPHPAKREVGEQSELNDLTGWLFYLLQSPQPLLIIEWHLDGQQGDTDREDVAPPPDPRSVLPQLLECYVCHMSSPSDRAFHASSLHEVVHATWRSIKPCDVIVKPNGKDHPLLFARGLNVVAEMEYRVDGKALITSLEYYPN